MLLVIIGIIVLWWLFSNSGSKNTSSSSSAEKPTTSTQKTTTKKTGENPFAIYEYTPKIPYGQCKECGCVDCMSFAMHVAGNAISAEQCPHLSDEAIIAITGKMRQTAPSAPMKLKCPDCHEVVAPDTVYCPHCGCLVKKT